MENGMIQVYFSVQARKAFKTIPRLPRTNELISKIQLHGQTALTLDKSSR
jgi:hypothetical protein